jgi:CRP-like cAMP-binding protein
LTRVARVKAESRRSGRSTVYSTPLCHRVRQAALLAHLAASGVPVIERRYLAGENPYMRGDADRGLWFLLEGTLGLHKDYGTFRDAIVRLLKDGGLFGVPSLRPAGSQRDTAEARSPCHAAMVPKGPLERHLGRDATCAPALLEAFAECGRDREAAAERLLRREVDSRLACLLLELAERFGEETARGTAVGVRLTHHDLSCMVACTREAVSKEMSRFQRAGMIEAPSRCRIVVLDKPSLGKLAGGCAPRPHYPYNLIETRYGLGSSYSQHRWEVARGSC